MYITVCILCNNNNNNYLKLELKPYNFIVCSANHETVEGVMRHIMNIFTQISFHNEY